MPQIKVRPDSLDEENRRFEQTPLTQPVFLNSVPKSGSHLLRNIVRMFVPVEQQYQTQFIQWGNLQQHRGAFDPGRPKLSWGHLWFSDASTIETAPARKILLYRDPYDWVIASARFFLSGEYRDNVEHLKGGALSIDSLLSLMIFGIHPKTPPMADFYQFNAVAWLASVDLSVRYEDLVRHAQSPEAPGAESFFRILLSACGIQAMPIDWQERIRIGADPRQSGTARDNLTRLEVKLPDALPDVHRRQVDFAAPGLRQVLGYD